jgi:nitrite reductase/ring-hydroxylating ferredoxin subunit
MVENERLICTSAALPERGNGVRFELPEIGERVTGFAVRYNGTPYGYINQCAHVPIELDWQPGDFFDLTKAYLICATHGAHYDPATGVCVMGPCKGRSLRSVSLNERNGNIYLRLEQHV